MNVRENLIRRIKDTLAIYAVRIDLDKGEASRAAENFYCGLLNILKGYDLRNMNLEKPNYPAIDLGDAAEGLGVQVTSTATRQKVQDTLDAMFRNGVEQEYPHLVMLITKEWRDSRKAFRMDGVCRFDPNADIWDTNWLLAQLDGIEALEKLEEIRDYLAKHLHLVREPAPALNLPLQSAMAEGAFVGREKELAEIAKRFETEHIVVLSGLGGMGKTELAVKFGREYQESGRGWAYFLHFSGSFGMTLRSNVHRIIPNYSMEGKNDAQIEADALAALNRGGKEDLLVLDNADSGSMTKLRRELSALRMRVLVTSRQESDHVMELGRLSDEELFGLFRCHGAELEESDMRELIEAVDGHTMTVELMARLLREERRKETLTRLKKALGERNLASGEFGRTESAYHASPDQARINEHLKAVFRVSDMSSAEKSILRFATLIGESGLDSEMFAKAAEPELKPEPVEPVKRRWFDIFRRKIEEKTQPVPKIRDVLQELADKGWLLWKQDDIKIHPVIRIVCIEEQEPTDTDCGSFLREIWNLYDPNKYEHKVYRQLAELFGISAEVLDDKHGKWSHHAAIIWKMLGNADKALPYSLQEVERVERNVPADDQRLGDAYYNIGNTYYELHRYDLSLEYVMKSFSISKKNKQLDSLSITQTYDALGANYRELGKYSLALEYHQKALSIREKYLSEAHVDIAESYNNLGGCYGAMGEYEKGIEFLLKALHIREKSLGIDHHELADSYWNVGGFYDELGKLDQAMEYALKALSIRKNILPIDHYDYVRTYRYIGILYSRQGNYEKAKEYLLEVIRIHEQILPGDHPDLAQSYSNVGNIYGLLDNRRKMLEYHLKAMLIKEQNIKADNVSSIALYNKVGDTYEELGEHEKALGYHQKVLQMRERVLPENHLDLAQSYNNVGYTYSKLGEYKEALENFQKALAIRERMLPENDHELAISCNNIALTYRDLGQVEEAASHMRRAADIINRSSLPESHEDRVNFNKWADELEAEVRQARGGA